MITLGLSAVDKAAFETALRQSHRIRTVARIHDRHEKIIHTFIGSILSGSIQVDATQTTSNLGFAPGTQSGSGPVRTLDLVVLLPRKDPAWLPGAPGDESAFADNFISILYGVWVDGLAAGPGWVDVPVFWGPITGLAQDGDQITISGSGKDVLGLDPVMLWNPLTIRKGTLRTTAIRRVLEAKGETRFDIPVFKQKMANTWSLDRHALPWPVAGSIARWGNWQLFYDGHGRARVRPQSVNPLWTFHSGDNGTLLGKPKISYDVAEARNLVEVLGSPPNSSSTRIRAVATPPASHPLSAESLARNGWRRFLVHVEDGVTVNDKREAQAIADRILNEKLTATVQIELDSLVIPHLEEGDRVAVKHGGQHIEFTLQRFTIPLTAGESMSIGLNRRVSWRRRQRGQVIYKWGR